MLHKDTPGATDDLHSDGTSAFMQETIVGEPTTNVVLDYINSHHSTCPHDDDDILTDRLSSTSHQF